MRVTDIFFLLLLAILILLPLLISRSPLPGILPTRTSLPSSGIDCIPTNSDPTNAEALQLEQLLYSIKRPII